MTEPKIAKRFFLLSERDQVDSSVMAASAARFRTVEQARQIAEDEATRARNYNRKPMYNPKHRKHIYEKGITPESLVARLKVINVTMRQFLLSAGINQTTYYRWKRPTGTNGKIYKPQASTLITLHRALQKLEREHKKRIADAEAAKDQEQGP